MRWLLLGCLLFAFLLQAQKKSYSIAYEHDTVLYSLTYKSLDSSKILDAYFKNKPGQLAIKKYYYFGKISGMYRAYYPNGGLYEAIVYRNGKRHGDYTKYDSLGVIWRKAKYKNGKLHGYYTDKKLKMQGRYYYGKKHGAWEYNIHTPIYRKEYYKLGELVGGRKWLPVFGTKKIEEKAAEEGRRYENEDKVLDTLHLPWNEKDTAFVIRYLPKDSIEHPAMQKAYYKNVKGKPIAVVKYVFNGFVNGIYKTYFPNGNVYQYYHYNAGLLEGRWHEYREDGTLKTKGNYLNGKKHGKWEYFLHTKDYLKEKYRQGKKIR